MGPGQSWRIYGFECGARGGAGARSHLPVNPLSIGRLCIPLMARSNNYEAQRPYAGLGVALKDDIKRIALDR